MFCDAAGSITCGLPHEVNTTWVWGRLVTMALTHAGSRQNLHVVCMRQVTSIFQVLTTHVIRALKHDHEIYCPSNAYVAMS
jgi:hypothetical protein